MNALWRALIWLDRSVNDKWLRGRWETISGRCHRRRIKGCRFCAWLCRSLNRVDSNHCLKAYFADRIHHPDLPI